MAQDLTQAANAKKVKLMDNNDSTNIADELAQNTNSGDAETTKLVNTTNPNMESGRKL